MPDYSNGCGVAKNWCLVAPGGGDWWFPNPYPDDPIVVADKDGGYTKTFGTSFAAPHVTGAAALVWQMFPFFSADQVRQTLLGTARDIGPPGVDEIYGYGLLDVGKAVLGPGRFDWGDFVVEQPGGVAYFENDIVGAGGLVKRGGGELVLTGHSSYAGATRVEGGFLSVMGSIASPTSIAAAGTLAGTGLITGNVSNAGTIWAGDRNGIGTLRIDGNYVQQAGGLLVQQFGPEGAQNHLAVTGTASLDGWVGLAGERQFLPRQLSMAVLTAGQGISGRFAGIEGPFGDGTAPFIRASLRYEPNTAYLDLQGLPFDTPGVCASTNQCAVGRALERGLAGADQDLRDVALLLQHAGTRDGARAALASLSGEVHAGLSTLALGGSSQLGSMIFQRLGALRSGQAEATTADAPLAYTASLAANPAAAMLMRLPAQSAAANNAWARGYGFTGRLGSDVNAGGASYRGGGVIGGFDRQITPSFLAGFSFGYSSTDADFRRHAGKGSIDAYEGAFYGSYASGKLRLDGLLGYGRLNLESERSISFGGLSLVLDGSAQLVLRDALLLGRDHVACQHRQHRAVHRHRHAHLVQRDLVEQDLHVLDRIDRDTGLADVACHARMVAVVAAMGREVEGHANALAARGKRLAIESVRFFRRREARVLADGPRTHRVHGGLRAAQVGLEARQRVGVFQALQIGRGVERLDGDAVRGDPVQCLEIPAGGRFGSSLGPGVEGGGGKSDVGFAHERRFAGRASVSGVSAQGRHSSNSSDSLTDL